MNQISSNYTSQLSSNKKCLHKVWEDMSIKEFSFCRLCGVIMLNENVR